VPALLTVVRPIMPRVGEVPVLMRSMVSGAFGLDLRKRPLG
jgi:hypothetical protein